MAQRLHSPATIWLGFAALACAVAAGCGDDDDNQLLTSSSSSSSTVGNGGGGAGGAGQGGAGGMASAAGGNDGGGGAFNPTTTGGGGRRPCSNELVGVVRDFQIAHPDFEGTTLGSDKGIVQPDLGADLKPIYAGPTPTTTTADNFNQWYRDVMGVNIAIPLTIPLVENTPGVFTFENNAFFPIDGQGFGNEGNPHNYHFTYEIHAEFEYIGGEVFTFTGDDDVFTFINGKLAIDLGGVHGAESETIDLDAQAAALGITVGGVYSLDFFFAERHTVESNFRIDTGIACFNEIQPPQ